MVQVRKASVRQAILGAAAEEFAELGLARATLASIAARAGTSTGNLYKYFSSKDELFAAAVPPELASELATLLRRRVESLGVEREPRRLGVSHPYRTASRELLEFTLAHRAQVLFLLRHAEGTPFAAFGEELAARLTTLAVQYAERAYPELRVTASRRRALARTYRSFLGAIASILAEETSPRALEEATLHLTTYHLAGLGALFEAFTRSGEEERR